MEHQRKSIVECTGIEHGYQRASEYTHVLQNLSLNIDQGEFLALMGPSGSGKTTLLNLIGGLDSPRTGTIAVQGLAISGLSARALADWRASSVGYIFQFYNLLPVLSAHANVELPLLLTGLSAAQRKMHAQTALELVGLSDRAHHKPSQLSGGQQQRVAIARAIVTDPSFIICDEPTGDLDRGAPVFRGDYRPMTR